MTLLFSKSRWSLRFQFKDNWRHLVKYWMYMIILVTTIGAILSGLPIFIQIFNGWQNETLNLNAWLLTTEGSFLLDFSQNFFKGFIEMTLSLIVTSIVFVIIVNVNKRLSGVHFTKLTKDGISPKTKLFLWLICLLILFLVIPPIIIFLFEPNVSIVSGVFWLGYSLELMVSLIIVLPFFALWWLALEIQPLDDTLEAWEEKVVEEEIVEVTQERYSFFKWIEKGEITGYYELRESKYNEGLRPEVIVLIQKELDSIEIKANTNGKVEKLKHLLENK